MIRRLNFGPSLLMALLVILGGCGRHVEPSGSAVGSVTDVNREPVTDPVVDDMSQRIEKIDAFIASDRVPEALQDAETLLIQFGEHPEALMTAARVYQADGQFEHAIELYDSVAAGDDRYLLCRGMAADLTDRLGHHDRAVERYRRLMQLAESLDNAAIARLADRQLASRLNSLGRRQEAAIPLRRLVFAGDVTQSELAALLSLHDAAWTDPADAAPSEPLWVGPLARARLLSSRHETAPAIGVLVDAMNQADFGSQVAGADRSDALTTADVAVSLLGRLAADADDRAALRRWWSWINDGAGRIQRQRQLADHWYAIAVLADRLELPVDDVAGCFVEAVRLNPTDRQTYGLLQNLADRIGNAERARQCAVRAELLKRTVNGGNRYIDADAVAGDVATERFLDALTSLGRPLESTLWDAVLSGRMASGSASRKRMAQAQSRFKQLRGSGEIVVSMPTDDGGWGSDRDPRDVAGSIAEALDDWLDVDIAGEARGEPLSPPAELPSGPIRLVSRSEWFDPPYAYRNASEQKVRDLHIYQQFGGAVGALDYDRNGRVDLYFGQGGAIPPQRNSTHSDSLRRWVDDRWVDRSVAAGVRQFGYAQSVCVADLNQDGFEDVLIGCLGPNACLINQGDGTFQAVEIAGWTDCDRWTTAVAVADGDGDGLPDIYEGCYLDDNRIFDPLPEVVPGRFFDPRGPESYRAADDWLHRITGQGRWESERLPAEDEEMASPAPALGVLAGQIDDRGGLDFFVANDTKPNRLWMKSDSGDWVDVAPVAGCAYSRRGGSGASMGIASGDLDRNGLMDLHVTNFHNEAVHDYRQVEPGRFVDTVAGSGLEAGSVPVLGFGTVAADLDRDGDLDLVVANGHIEDHSYRGVPHRMSTQVWRQSRGQFSLVAGGPEDWATPCLGRGLIQLDVDLDCRVDLLLTTLDTDAKLFHNQTESQGSAITINLVATAGERSAVGSKVTVRTDAGTLVHWSTSGGGYACHPQSTLLIGLGAAKRIEDVTVHWNSGAVESFGPVAGDFKSTDGYLLLVEGATSQTSQPGHFIQNGLTESFGPPPEK